ncbi:(d)CMP kinase [Salibacter halophilus]|uniref:Cytidylate kinase n=1 Tax=Salibacter halophilus TaxID=1803916 RepID=A0A6N6M7I4_9FLAO|nr:(d)CMP kinase [Salibacter halophilus]KAB1066038.1 (d)CMP kinase [Salibacter halophilus]
MSPAKINIAIDGYSSCGKSTLAKQLAKKLHYIYVDTGAMYRSVALFALDNGFFESDFDKEKLINSLNQITIRFERNENGLQTILNGENVEESIRSMRVSERVSEVAAIPEVRKKLVSQQQEMGKEKGVVMDGRDIGTVVFPDAELKIFMTASPSVRAQRRYDELKANGKEASMEEVKKNLEHRDYIDTHRSSDPLKQADDALVLDNTDLTPDEQLQKALDWSRERMGE